MHISCLICTDDYLHSTQIRNILMTYCTPEIETWEISLKESENNLPEHNFHIIILDSDMSFEEILKCIDRLRRHDPEAVFVVSVDYRFFSFANNLMTLEHVEFIPKPLRKETLQETVTREVEQIRHRRDSIMSPGQLKAIVNDNIPVIRQHYLSMLMRRNVADPETIRNKFYTLQIDCPGPCYTVLIVDMPAEREKKDFEAICFLVLSTLKSTLKIEGYQAYCFFDSEFRINCLVGHEDRRQHSSINEIVDRVCNYCLLYMDVHLCCGIGEAVESAAFIHTSFVQANKDVVNIHNGYSERSIIAVTQYIEENLGNSKLDLLTVSSHFGFSKTYFCRFFHKVQGEGFAVFLRERRIEWAKNLLISSNMELSEIARLSGFSSEKYFSTVFKKIEGITPGQYRKYYCIP